MTSAARIVALLLAAPLLRGQFVNRATWLGSDEEGVRRNFAQGTEYYLDRMSYVVTPPWWDRGLVRFDNAVHYRLGSVNSREFTFEGRLDHAIALGDGVTFRYHLLQSENRDTRFVRNELALEYALDDTTALFAQGEPLADKSRIDLSLGAWLWRRDGDALRVMVTAVDEPGDKSRVVQYERRPFGVLVSGAFGDRESHRIAFELAGQLPFEQRQLDDGERFAMQRYIGSIDAHLRLGERDWLVLASESEYASKELRPLDALDPLREDFGRRFHQLRAEWWRDGDVPWSVGVVHTLLDERGRRPNDPGDELETRRREWYGILRLRLQATEKLSFEPQLLAGDVRDRFRDGVDDRREHRFEGKLAWNARWDFSPNVTLALIVATQLDQLGFGGGGAQFVARF